MIDVKWIVAAFVAALCATGARAQPASTGFDPLDAKRVSTIDWPRLPDDPQWVQAPAPGPRQQVGEASFWRSAKVSQAMFDGTPVDLFLQVAKENATLRRLSMHFPVLITDTCHSAHGRLAQAYGAPEAERVHASAIELPNTRLQTEHAQWRAGATMVTLSCLELIKPRGIVYLTQVEFEPVAEALPLRPLFALRCPGLVAGDAASETAADPLLIFDSRELFVERSGPKPSIGAGRVRFAADLVAFELKDGSQVRIERHAGRYAVTHAGSGARDGVCTDAAVPG